MTDVSIADLELAIYQDPGAPKIDWEWSGTTYGVRWAHYIDGDESVIALAGSETFEDWIRDLFAVPDILDHPGLGPVHSGFYIGMPETLTAMLTRPLRPRITVIGHSLGAARSSILCGLMVLSGLRPALRVAWGEPRPGFKGLTALLAGMAARSYRNACTGGHDVVTDVPFHLPPLDDFVHAAPLIDVCAPPPPSDPWGPFRFHHMQLYRAAMPVV